MKVKSINMSRILMKQVDDAGLTNIFNPVKVKKSASKDTPDGQSSSEASAQRSKFNQKLIDAFVASNF